MIIKRIYLENFRCYDSKTVSFSPQLNIIIGSNATGKTSILEAIHVLCLAKSNKTANDFDLIRINQSGYAVRGELTNGRTNDVIIIQYANRLKRVKKNNVAYKHLSDYIGYANVIIYSPNDFGIFSGGASLRRRFFDIVFCQISKQYMSSSSEYKRLLKERNLLLKELSIKNDKNTKNLLDIITKQLVEQGKKIISMRQKIIKKINDSSATIHRNLSAGKERLEIRFIPNVEISEYERELENSINEDLMRGQTQVGPHRDDYIFIINNKNIGDYGSQGQQKSAILSAKLACIELVKEVKGVYPIVLLDDVFSELDKARQNQLLSVLNKKAQTIVSTSTISDIEPNILEKANIIKLEERGEQ